MTIIINQYILVIILSLISLSTIFFCIKYNEIKKTIKITNESLKTLLRSEIINHCNTQVNKNCITMVEKDCINSLYIQYVTLTGKEDIQEFVIKINTLSIEKYGDDRFGYFNYR